MNSQQLEQIKQEKTDQERVINQLIKRNTDKSNQEQLKEMQEYVDNWMLLLHKNIKHDNLESEKRIITKINKTTFKRLVIIVVVVLFLHYFGYQLTGEYKLLVQLFEFLF